MVLVPYCSFLGYKSITFRVDKPVGHFGLLRWSFPIVVSHPVGSIAPANDTDRYRNTPIPKPTHQKPIQTRSNNFLILHDKLLSIGAARDNSQPLKLNGILHFDC